MMPVAPLDSNSNTVYNFAPALEEPAPQAPPEDTRLYPATDRLIEQGNAGHVQGAVEAAKELFRQGHASIADSSLQTLNTLPVVGALVATLNSSYFRMIPRDSLHVLAKTLRFFSELTYLRSREPESALSCDLDAAPNINALDRHISIAKKNSQFEIAYELLRAREASKRWKHDSSFISRYHQDIYGLLIGVAFGAVNQTGSPFTVTQAVTLLEKWWKTKEKEWYDPVLAITALGKHTSSNPVGFEAIQGLIQQGLKERFVGRRSKVLLAVVDILAEAVWSGDEELQLRALDDPKDKAGLVQLAEIKPFPNDESKYLWKVRCHAFVHLTALKYHRAEKTRERVIQALKELNSTSEEVTRHMPNLRRDSPLESYRSAYKVDTNAWGSGTAERTLEVVEGVAERQHALQSDTQATKSHVQEITRFQRHAVQLVEVVNARLAKIEGAHSVGEQAVGPDVLPADGLGTCVLRADYFTRILQSLVRQKRSPENPTVLHGLGGVGKSTLALYTIHSDRVRQRCGNRRYWFDNSDDPERLETQFHQLAGKLKLLDESLWRRLVVGPWFSDAKQVRQEAVKRVLNYFSALDEPYLIVFDNAGTRQSLQRYLPSGGGEILVTTRNPDWQDAIPVERFARTQSCELIDRILGTNSAGGNELAEAMGDHPLGLKQACRYILANPRLDIGRFLNLLEEQSHTILESQSEFVGVSLPNSVATLWKMTLDKLDADTSALLSQLAYLSPDKIPFALRNSMGTQEAGETLRAYALVQHQNVDTLSIHRLLQRVVRLRDPRSANTLASALQAITDTYIDDPRQKEERVVNWGLLPHGEALLNRCSELFDKSHELQKSQARCLTMLGRILQDLGDATGAKEKFEKALAIDSEFHGAETAVVAADLRDLGSALRSLGDPNGAKEQFEKALAIDTQLSDNDQETADMATDLDHLGLALRALGDAKEAKEQFERACTIFRRVHVPKSADVATVLDHWGLALRDLGKTKEAKAKYIEALEIAEEVYKPNDPRMAVHWDHLGRALRALGDTKGAKQKFEAALAIAKVVYGLEHPTVADYLGSLGGAWRDLDRPEEAKECYKEALRIDRNVYGPDHPDVATDLVNLGAVLRDLGNEQGAKDNYEEALRIDKKVYGESHPEVATDLNSLGRALHALGDIDGALDNYTKAYFIARYHKSMGARHWRTKLYGNNVSAALRTKHNMEAARRSQSRPRCIVV